MAVVLSTRSQRFLGLSTDTKPSGVPAGSRFYETNTLLWYVYDGSAWSMKPWL